MSGTEGWILRLQNKSRGDRLLFAMRFTKSLYLMKSWKSKKIGKTIYKPGFSFAKNNVLIYKNGKLICKPGISFIERRVSFANRDSRYTNGILGLQFTVFSSRPLLRELISAHFSQKVDQNLYISTKAYYN